MQSDQAINSTQTFTVCLLLVFNDCIGRRSFFFMQLAKILNCPGLEVLRNLDSAKKLVNLLFELSKADALLWTVRILTFGAMIVDVVAKLRSAHLRNQCLAARTGISVSAGEFETALGASYLTLFFGRYHGAAFAANETGEGKFEITFGSRVAVPAKE